jgi:hypothetical protein
MRVFDGQNIGQRDQVAYTVHLFEQLHFRVSLSGHLFDPPIVFLNLCVQRFDLSQQRPEGFAQLRVQS